jgi:DNA polymerase I-like protein with 3'-5' exonuclease and polymerase domains
LAQVCFDLFKKSALGDALNQGIDVHLWVGAQLMSVSYEDAVELLAAGDPVAKDMRQLAKAANFGYPGGCSAKRFVGIAHAYGVPVDLKESARLRALWFRTWPEMRLFFDHVSECTDGDGFYYVKQPRVPRLRSRCTWTSACNSHFQGLAADGAKAALYAVTREQFTDRGSDLYNTRCVAFVHDEIILEAPEDQAHRAAMRLKAVMEAEFNAYVPDCPTTAEPTLMRYWSKEAKQIWDGDILVPWEGAA